MQILIAVLCGFLLDLLLGDPAWMPHPVVLMGRAIDWAERILRKCLPESSKGKFTGGCVLAVCLPVCTLVLTGGICTMAARFNLWLGFAVQVLWCWQTLAAKGLASESKAVYCCLAKRDLPAARKAVARIVGRDTEQLTAEGVTKATVETVAENFADGVAAPLFYMLIGGAPLVLCYKAINTMDSMIGYKNNQYLYFGRAAARLDDAANVLPARIAALCWIAAAGLTGGRFSGAWKIWRRDRRNHASPNSAQTEAACAGGLGVQLGGDSVYFGTRCSKPTIGDALRAIEPEDILRANHTMYMASALALLAGLAIRWFFVMMLKCG